MSDFNQVVGSTIIRVRELRSRGLFIQANELLATVLPQCMEVARAKYNRRLHMRNPQWAEDTNAEVMVQFLLEVYSDNDYIVRNPWQVIKKDCYTQYHRLMVREGLEDDADTSLPDRVPSKVRMSIDRLLRESDSDTSPHPYEDVIENNLPYLYAEEVLEAAVKDTLMREVFRLRVYDKYGWDEIAELVGYSERTCRRKFIGVISLLRDYVMQYPELYLG